MKVLTIIYIVFIAASMTVPLYQEFPGWLIDDSRFTVPSICGYYDELNDVFAIVASSWFTTVNPNNQTLCDFCLKVETDQYSEILPIKDSCDYMEMGCSRDRFQLSDAACQKFQCPDSVYDSLDAKFTFVNCN